MPVEVFVDMKPANLQLGDVGGFETSSTKEANQPYDFEENTEAEKKLVRKIDLFLLPCIWIVYLL